MNSSPPEPKEAKLVDPDLVEQAVVGHGVPSQDPADAAQFALEPGEAERESKSALMGGGAVAGMAAGAVVGAVVAGPLGVLVLWLGTNWPDLLVGFATAIIAIKGGVEILRDARAETKKSERRSS